MPMNAMSGHFVMYPYSDHMVHKSSMEFGGYTSARQLSNSTIGMVSEAQRASSAHSVFSLPAENYSSCTGNGNLDQSDDFTRGQDSSLEDEDESRQNGNKGFKAPWTPEVRNQKKSDLFLFSTTASLNLDTLLLHSSTRLYGINFEINVVGRHINHC
jgi:hypothetical protein